MAANNHSEQLFKAAKIWWRNKRPCEWNRYKHLTHPTVNCVGDDERGLAIAVSDIIKAKATQRGRS